MDTVVQNHAVSHLCCIWLLSLNHGECVYSCALVHKLAVSHLCCVYLHSLNHGECVYSHALVQNRAVSHTCAVFIYILLIMVGVFTVMSWYRIMLSFTPVLCV